MNKVINVNLGGNAYQLDERGYDALRVYLDNATAKLAANPDRQEIIHDIELAIADRCRATLNAGKTVVTADEVDTILGAMGPVDDGTPPDEAGAATSASTSASGTSPPAADSPDAEPPPSARPARLYRLTEGAMLEGVCNGIAAYFGLDPTWVRLAVLAATLASFGLVAIAYFAMVLVVPVATTAEEKAAARGAAFTAQEFIRRARAGYYEGFRTFPDRHAHRAWKRQFKRDMRDWRRSFRAEIRSKFQTPPWTEAGPGGAPPAWTPGPGWWWLGFFGSLWSLLCVAAIFSLIVKGSVLGLVWPAGAPLWVGIVVLICVHQFVSRPLHHFRHAYRRGGYYGACGGGLWDTVAGLGLLAVLLWLGDRYIPSVHHALQQIPPALQQVVDTLRHAWGDR